MGSIGIHVGANTNQFTRIALLWKYPQPQIWTWSSDMNCPFNLTLTSGHLLGVDNQSKLYLFLKLERGAWSWMKATLMAVSIYSSCWGLHGLWPMNTATAIRLQRRGWGRGSLLPWSLGPASGQPLQGLRSSSGHSPSLQLVPGPL